MGLLSENQMYVCEGGNNVYYIKCPVFTLLLWVHWRHPSAVLVLSSCGNYKRPPNHSVVSAATSRPAIHYLLFVMGSLHWRSSQHRSAAGISCFAAGELSELPCDQNAHIPTHFEINSEI